MSEDYLLLMDPSWAPTPDRSEPPWEATVGLWPVGPDGTVQAFRSNLDYRPSDPGAAADPLDVLFRLAADGEPDLDAITAMLRDAVFDIALTEQAQPLVVLSPDDIACLLATTSATQRAHVNVACWRRSDLIGLIGLLPDGVDVLFNPYGPAPSRLAGDFLRDSWMLNDKEAGATRRRVAERSAQSTVKFIPWSVP